jgi:hypothetical protein
MRQAMASESARMNSAAEARFRVQAPNSQPRAVKVVALDASGAAAIERLANTGRSKATFFKVHDNLDEEIGAADLVVMVAGPGGQAQDAAAIGRACSEHRVMTTGFIVCAGSGPERELSKTLAQLRPWSLMVVIANSDDYIDDMMAALRA